MRLIYKSMQSTCCKASCGSFFIAVSLCSGSNTLLAQENSANPLEEIVVSAKKRNRDLQEVDISMSVVSADTINTLQLRSLPDAAALIENVSLFEDFPGAGIPTWVIRGVGLQDFNSNNTPTAGVYLDNSYQVATVMGGANLFDIDQLEVLKGPQGGLYGRNTSGGAVVLNTRRAELGTYEGNINAGVASWQRRTLDGAVNIPVNATTAVRLAGNVENSDDGWQRNIYTGQSHGALDRWDIRSWALFRPIDDFELQWKVQAGADDSEIALGRSIGVYNANGSSQFCSAALAGHRDDTTCINYGGVNRVANKTGTPERISNQASDGSEVFSDPINQQQNDYINSVLELSWQLADAELKAITAYDKFDYGVALDLDGGKGEYGHRYSSSAIEVISHELQLISTGNQALQWLAGVTWSEEKFTELRDFNLRENTLAQLYRGRVTYDQFTDSASAFADLEYAINEQWSVNANLRYTIEDKEYRNGDVVQLLTTPRYFGRNLKADYELDSPYSGSLALNWMPSETTFTYAKVSSGFKSGGFFGGFPLNPAEIDPYKEETIVAWELGIKQSWPQRNLGINAAAFYYDYQDVQGFIRAVNPLTGTGIDRLDNQGDARHKGMEVQMNYQPLDSLRLELGLAWLDAKFIDSGVTTRNIAGNQVVVSGRRPYAPSLSGNLMVQYTRQLIADALLTMTMAYNYRSEFTGYTTSPVEVAVKTLPGYGVLDASAMLLEEGKPWKVNVWVKNMLDRTYRTRVKDDGVNSFIDFFGEPRSLGVTLSYDF